MQIVIDISEETYEYWKEHKHEYVLAEAIANGIPIPKGHGRLIDKNELMAEMSLIGLVERKENGFNACVECVECMPTIIEADTNS